MVRLFGGEGVVPEGLEEAGIQMGSLLDLDLNDNLLAGHQKVGHSRGHILREAVHILREAGHILQEADLDLAGNFLMEGGHSLLVGGLVGLGLIAKWEGAVDVASVSAVVDWE